MGEHSFCLVGWTVTREGPQLVEVEGEAVEGKERRTGLVIHVEPVASLSKASPPHPETRQEMVWCPPESAMG